MILEAVHKELFNQSKKLRINKVSYKKKKIEIVKNCF